jgi:hypothetical protein
LCAARMSRVLSASRTGRRPRPLSHLSSLRFLSKRSCDLRGADASGVPPHRLGRSLPSFLAVRVHIRPCFALPRPRPPPAGSDGDRQPDLWMAAACEKSAPISRRCCGNGAAAVSATKALNPTVSRPSETLFAFSQAMSVAVCLTFPSE